MSHMSSQIAILNTVFEHYLATGNGMDAYGIAEALQWSAGKVYRILRESGGAVLHTVAVRDERPRMSRNYRSMQAGTSQVWIYEPTKEYLRGKLCAAITVARAEGAPNPE